MHLCKIAYRRFFFFVTIACFVISSLFSFRTLASDDERNDMTVLETRTTEDSVYVYIRGDIDTNDIKVQIGSDYCDNIDIIQMQDNEIKVRTLLILDNSLSTGNPWGGEAIALMDSLIKDHASNEEFKILTFAQGLNELTSYSSDYLALQSVVAGIKYENQDSYLTDILYKLLDDVVKEQENIFYRFIIIADGADDNEITYTQEELRDLMKTASVPIYTVGIDGGKNSKGLENLFSYSRQTNARYWKVKKGNDPAPIESEIEADMNMFCIRITPERVLMDGARKETKITVMSGGKSVDLRTSLLMPFASGPAPTEVPSIVATPTEIVEKANEETPTIVEESIPEEKESPGVLVYALIALAVVVAIAIILLVVISIRNKNKKDDEKNKWNYLADSDDDDDDKTVLIGKDTDGDDHTLMLWDRSDNTPHSYIILTALDNSSRVFRVPIINSIIIGRKKPADIVLDYDRAVSSKHCMITKRGNQYYVKDMESANKTFYNDEEVINETLIEDGGILELGKCKYKFSSEE